MHHRAAAFVRAPQLGGAHPFGGGRGKEVDGGVHVVRRSSSRSFPSSAFPALELVPSGDGTTDHLPPDSRVPARSSIQLPSKPGQVLVVGRERPSDVRLGIGTVSRTHVAFEADGDSGCVWMTDAGSSNGTEVDGRRVEPGVPFLLSPGDVVTLGDPHLARYEVAAAGAAEAPVAGLSGTRAATERGKARARTRGPEVGEAFNAGAAGVRRARDALVGAGNIFAVLRGAAGNRSLNVEGEKTKRADGPAGLELELQREEEETEEEVVRQEEVEVVTARALLDDNSEYSDVASSPSSLMSLQSPSTSRSTFIMAEERVVLIPVGWPGPVIELAPGCPVVLGSGRRRGDADVILTAAGVDSAHASVLRVGGAVYIEDLGSSVGTFVGGRQITAGLQYTLTVGADVQLGDGGCAFTVECLDDAAGEELELGRGRWRGRDAVSSSAAGGTEAGTMAAYTDTIRGADVSLNATNTGETPAASPWGLIGGLKGVGDNLGAAIFNSKINVNYQYKPTIQVGGVGRGTAGLADLKSALLLALADTERGLRADQGRRKKIEQLARALEAKNPTSAPLRSPLMNGRWALQYTSALEVLGKGRPTFMRPKGAIFQTVDIFALQVKNEESFEPLPFLKFTSASTQDLEAQTESRAAVRPKDYRVAGIKVGAPPKTPGRRALDWEMEASGAGSLAWLDTTFVDGEMRISRSQSGDLFILVRDDPNDP